MTAEPRGTAVRWVLLVGGVLGTLAAFVLTVEKVRILEDPTYIPSCSINPILSCGSVMRSDQAEVFGFPNPLIGLALFPIVGSVGAVLLAGAEVPRSIWRGLQVGVTLGLTFVGWLTFQSLYRIGALCPYCLVVWVVMPALFVFVTVHNLSAGHLGERLTSVGRAVASARPLLLTVWYVTVASLVLIRFWDYWRTLP